MAQVICYGGAGMVTGSCHLLEVRSIQVMIDCGMIQGGGWQENYTPFGFDPKRIDYLIITHAHNDHIGRIPKLVKEGFCGEIITTKATWDMAFIMLQDSAALLQEEYETQFRKAQRRGEEASIEAPLYTKEHVEQLFTCKHRLVAYDETLTLAPFLSLSLRNAGHILGSSFVQIHYEEEEGVSKSVTFSGDLGASKRLLLDAPSKPKAAHTLFIESTYGDRDHRPLAQSLVEFKEAIVASLHQGGSVVIPSFALERTQEILWLLHGMHKEGLLGHTSVYLDSPLAIEATKIYNNYPQELNQTVGLHVNLGDDPFDFPQLILTPRKKDSIAINEVQKRAIIIAGSGMCTGGRVLHHLKQRIWNPKNTVIFVGFQVQGTLGREIVDGASYVRIYGEDIKVRARICTINGLSAHADRSDMLAWIKQIEGLEMVHLIHGEVEKMALFKEFLTKQIDAKVHIVKAKEAIYL